MNEFSPVISTWLGSTGGATGAPFYRRRYEREPDEEAALGPGPGHAVRHLPAQGAVHGVPTRAVPVTERPDVGGEPARAHVGPHHERREAVRRPLGLEGGEPADQRGVGQDE